MQMNRDELLSFATNRPVSTKGLMFGYSVNENDEVVIDYAGVVGDGSMKNKCLYLAGKKDGSNPTEKELDDALEKYIQIYGRKPFNIKMIFQNEELRNCTPRFAYREEDVVM